MTTHLTSQQANFGKRILPIKRLELFSADEWEEFIEEWLDLKKSEYLGIDRFGGAGDKGRDVVAYVTDKKDPNYVWDCYQCKHYNDALTPTHVYKEIGKILYYTYQKDYPTPRSYFFIAPKGCGTSLSKLLQNADALKTEILDNWVKYCKDNITEKKSIELDGDFLVHVEKFDYSIFDKVAPKIIIEEHSKHTNHITIFGGGLPPRDILNEGEIPKEITSTESVYISQLLLAYGSDCSEKFSNFESLATGSNYQKHFNRTRINFHHAEQLRNFSRDNLPVGVFERFQDEILDGVANLLEEDYTSGFKKVKVVENHVSSLVIASNPLSEVSFIKDRHGICHQLTNDGKIVWIV